MTIQESERGLVASSRLPQFKTHSKTNMDASTKKVMENPVLMESHLKEAMKRSKDDLKLTKEEEDRLTSAFKEPEFKKLMGEYLQEISDPKNKAEYDQYINQLEKDNKVPKGTKLVRPVAGFCVKTKKLGSGEKVFVNICAAPDAGKATSKATNKGQSWDLPHLMGPPHMEQDKNKTPCMTFDVCFHPDTLKRATENVRFQQLLITTALETIQEKTTQFGQTIKVEKNYRVLKGVKAMGGKPNMLSVKLDSNDSDGAASTKNSTGKKNSKSKIDKTSASHKKQKKKNEKKEIFKCVVVESGEFDMRNYMGDGAKNRVHRHRPQKLVIRVTLDGVKSLNNVELDVSERALVLLVPGKPKFEKRLPYPVNGDKGKAKFHKSRSLLEVTVPVLPPAPDELEEVEEVEVEEDPGTEDHGIESVVDVDQAKTSVVGTTTDSSAAAKQKVIEAKTEETKEETKDETKEETTDETPKDAPPAIPVAPTKVAAVPAGLDDDMMRKIREAREAYANWASKGTENDNTAKEAALKESEQAKKENEELRIKNGGSPTSVPDDSNAVSFMKAASFDGKKPGYVFKMGPNGLGYYFDTLGGTRTLPTRTGAATETKEGTESPSSTSSTLPTSSAPNTETENTTDVVETPLMLEIPPHRFRQDKRVLTLLIQISGIDKSTVQVEFTPTSTTLRCFANGKEYGLRLVPPKGMTSLPTQSKFNVSDRNMAVIVAKEQAEKWGSDMIIESFEASKVLVADDATTTMRDSATDESKTTPEAAGSTGLLSNTLMYALS